MGQYIEEAMCKFLKDNGIPHGELHQTGISTDFKFVWIDANISMKLIDEFEIEFNVSQVCSSGIEDGKWLDVEFCYGER